MNASTYGATVSEASEAIFEPMARMLATSADNSEPAGISGMPAGCRCSFKVAALPFPVKGYGAPSIVRMIWRTRLSIFGTTD